MYIIFTYPVFHETMQTMPLFLHFISQVRFYWTIDISAKDTTTYVVRLVVIVYNMNHARRIPRSGAYDVELLSADNGNYAAGKRRTDMLYAVHHNWWMVEVTVSLIGGITGLNCNTFIFFRLHLITVIKR